MKYISLKEASLISGYAPDYVGQLIRSGKLSGKQVYSNVAWVTTEVALRDYLEKQPRSKSGAVPASSFESDSEIGTEVPIAQDLFDRALPKFLKGFLLGVVVVSIGFAVLLFYIFSVQIDAKLKENAVRNAETGTSGQSSSGVPQK